GDGLGMLPFLLVSVTERFVRRREAGFQFQRPAVLLNRFIESAQPEEKPGQRMTHAERERVEQHSLAVFGQGFFRSPEKRQAVSVMKMRFREIRIQLNGAFEGAFGSGPVTIIVETDRGLRVVN